MIVTRRHLLGTLVAGTGVGFASARRPGVFVSHLDDVMGTSLDVRIRARSAAEAERAEAFVLAEIRRQSSILSGFDPASEFSRWARTRDEPMAVSPELSDVLVAFDTWRARTDGALDPSSEAVSRLWRAAARNDRWPEDEALSQAVIDVRQRHWAIDRGVRVATRTSAVPLALHSFAKSYVIDRAAQHALAHTGVLGILVNAGGDIVVRGDWTTSVAVADPFAHADNAEPIATVRVRDRAVATSGGTHRGFDIDGRRFSHIVDPRTAWPVDHVAGATVVARSAVVAGALATAMCVLTPDESRALVRSAGDVEFLLVLADGNHIESDGWGSIGTAPAVRKLGVAPVAHLAAAGLDTWPAGWQLTIALDLARPSGGFGRRSYVAAWIEDKDKFPIRTLALWFDGKARFLPELRAWYRSDRLRSLAEGTAIVGTVTSATRNPGKYTLQWDGKDNAGKPVAAGTYTVCVEVAREHGTYQLIRQQMDCSGVPKQVTLPGGTEINGVSLNYQQNGSR